MKKNIKEVTAIVVATGVSALTSWIFNAIKKIVLSWFKTED